MKNQLLKKINKQEARFIEEYLKHGDRVAAFKKAYRNVNVDEDRIHGLATQMLKSAHITHELKQYMTDSEIKYGLSKGMLVAELKRIAFFDIKDLYDEDGNPKSASELRQMGRAISEVLVSKVETGGMTETHMKVKLANKLTAIEMLNKMMGYNEPEEVRLVDEDGNTVKPQMTVVFQKYTGELPASTTSTDEAGQ